MDKDEVRKAIEAVRKGYVPSALVIGGGARKPDRERDLLLAFLAERELERMDRAEPGCLCPPDGAHSLCPVHFMVKCQ